MEKKITTIQVISALVPTEVNPVDWSPSSLTQGIQRNKIADLIFRSALQDYVEVLAPLPYVHNISNYSAFAFRIRSETM